jgi:AcrR family transcriptional regulator
VPPVDIDPTAQRPPGYPPRRIVPPAAAKLRILATADRLFYDEGIRSVGIDRLISESTVTKATFYKHYGSKDRLIVEYVRGRAQTVQSEITEMIDEAGDPEKALRAIIAAIVAQMQRPDFRGCPFINAAAEFGDPTHPVRTVVTDHRDWHSDALADQLGKLGHPLPGDGADDLMLARDGAMTGGYAGDPIAAAAAFQRAAERILADARG